MEDTAGCSKRNNSDLVCSFLVYPKLPSEDQDRRHDYYSNRWTWGLNGWTIKRAGRALRSDIQWNRKTGEDRVCAWRKREEESRFDKVFASIYRAMAPHFPCTMLRSLDRAWMALNLLKEGFGPQFFLGSSAKNIKLTKSVCILSPRVPWVV